MMLLPRVRTLEDRHELSNNIAFGAGALRPWRRRNRLDARPSGPGEEKFAWV